MPAERPTGKPDDTASSVEAFLRASGRVAGEQLRQKLLRNVAKCDRAIQQWAAWRAWKALPACERAGKVQEPVMPLSSVEIIADMRQMLVEEIARLDGGGTGPVD